MHDGLLDMRMDRNEEKTAKQVVNTYPEEELSRIFYEYGEERYARQIARKICEKRKTQEISTTLQLVDIIKSAVPNINKSTGHPAKRVFQAIRIEVNNEIQPLYETVKNCTDCLNPGGRLVIITFHSLEDRAVKRAFQSLEGKCICPKSLPYCVCGAKVEGKIITKKPIEPQKREQEENPRSKSAKLRIFEKL